MSMCSFFFEVAIRDPRQQNIIFRGKPKLIFALIYAVICEFLIAGLINGSEPSLE